MTPAKASAARRFAPAGSTPEAEPCPDDGGRLVEEIVASIREELPAFADIDVDDIRRMAASDIRRGQAAMAERRLPTQEELDASAAVTVGLARASVPLDAINQSRRIAVRRIFDAWRERASSTGADPAAQVEYLYTLWNWTDAITSRAASAYRQVEVEVEGRDEDQRAWYLRGLLDGSLSPLEAQSRAAAYGLLPGGRYTALRARPGAEVDVRQLQRVIETSGATDQGGVLAAVVDGHVWGLVSREPSVPAGQGVAGLGPAGDLAGAAASFRLASRALETATAFGLTGVVSIDDLSLRPVILSEEHVGERLIRRYLDPLRELGEFGATLELTVQEYLRSGMRIDESAKALIIHPNTLRHRIDRFQQLTGADLRRTEDVIEVWWALERRRVSAARAPRAAG
ncbi:MAG TPA: helix-turn-helix domain-containing protein [Thermoleophilaceae bacterium]|nr:helix-turn-helix domain-containing protein [Thermoleophilaceae bacterium]